jgi:hypothetical protein
VSFLSCPHLVRHGDVGAAGVGHYQRTARLPEVALGIEMENLRAHAGIAGALQDAAAAAADRIVQRRIAERELASPYEWSSCWRE